MSTAGIGGGTIAASVKRDKISVAEDPRTRRFGLLPGVHLLEVHPRETGRQSSLIPYGVPVRFDTFPDMSVPTWDVDPESKAEPVAPKDLTAREAIDNVRRAAWQSSADMGFRVLDALTPLSDEEADALIALILPELDPADCRYGEENTSEVVVDFVVGDVARSKTVNVFRCVACTLAWLESDVCKEAAEEKSPAAVELRKQALQAYRVNRDFFRAKWNEWKAEMEERAAGKTYGLARLGDAHFHVMHQLHEVSPAAQAAETISRSQQASADAMKEGMREVARELAASIQPQQPAFDMNEVVRLAKEQLRAEMEAEKEQPKGPEQPKSGSKGGGGR